MFFIDKVLAAATTSEASEVAGFFQNILQAITSPDLQKQLVVVKVVFLIFSAVFLIMIIYLLLTTSYFEWLIWGDIKNFFFPRFFERRNLLKNWKKIKSGLHKRSQAQWKLAVIEAVRFFDRILEEIGYSGDNLDEKIKKLQQDEISTWKALLDVQASCRDIIRDPDYGLSKAKAKEIIEVFEMTLKDLEVF